MLRASRLKASARFESFCGVLETLGRCPSIVVRRRFAGWTKVVGTNLPLLHGMTECNLSERWRLRSQSTRLRILLSSPSKHKDIYMILQTSMVLSDGIQRALALIPVCSRNLTGIVTWKTFIGWFQDGE